MKETAIHVSNLKKTFHQNGKDIEAVKNISFDIYKEEFVAFIGANGAGKTTTLKCLSGLLRPDSGDVSVLEYNPSERKYDFLSNIALVMGNKSQLWWELPPFETFLLNKEIYQISDEKYNRVVNEMINVLGVRDVVGIPTRNLSLGERMKCELIASLLHTPELVFLDEPTLGLDIVSQQRLREFFKDYNHRYKATILLTSHDMGDISDLCKRVIVVDHGIVLFDGKISDLVKGFVKYKRIGFVLEDNVDPKVFSSYGFLESFTGNSGVLQVDIDKVSSVAQRLLNSFKVIDIGIQESSLEDVVKNIFNKGYLV